MTESPVPAIELPGAVSVSRLRVYDDPAGDGPSGGTPHVHLVSAEAYVVVGGSGLVQTLDIEGLQETRLHAGVVASFAPGTIHRLVNEGGLDIVAVMQNAGLPESGDAVMTFLPEKLQDPEAYRAVAGLPPGASDVHTRQAVAARRRAALSGWEALVDSMGSGDPEPLRAFYRSAQSLVADRVSAWRRIADGPAPFQAARSLTLLEAIERGDATPLEVRSFAVVERDDAPDTWGMCGRLTTWTERPERS